MWSLVYSGLPDSPVVDQGTAYTSREMKQYLEVYGVRPDEAPIETAEAIGVAERYHTPLGLAYERTWADSESKTSNQ